MENYSHQSHPDSGESSPLSREIDSENPPSWDEPPTASANYKVKFMCSYGGKIQPRQHDNQLSYVGGDTKILSADRNISLSTLLAKLSSLCDASPSDICFKYQLPGEELDALISVTNDEDLEHLMLEYDRLNRSSPKPARLRMFLFSINPKPIFEEYLLKDTKPQGSWFVDALNSVQFRPLDNSPPPPTTNAEPSNPDFLFGFDKAMNYKVVDPNPNFANDIPGLNDQEPVALIQSQIERFRVTDGEKLYEDVNPNVNSTQIYQNEYYKTADNISPAPPPPQAVPVPISAGYWPERHIPAGNYQISSSISADQQPVYLIQTPSGGVYHPNPSTRQISNQGYYSFPRMMPEAYHEQLPPTPSSLIQHNKVTGMQEGIGMVRQAALPPAIVTEQGYTQVSYVDRSGRPVYYTLAGAPPPTYQIVAKTAGSAVADGRAGVGGGMGPTDSKSVGGKAPQTSSV